MDNGNTIIFFGKKLLINPVAFCLGDKPVYWYGIIIALGFCLAIFYGYTEAKRTGLKTDHIANVVLVAAPIAIIGARLYYVIFSWKDYKDNLLDILPYGRADLPFTEGLLPPVLQDLFTAK